MTFVDEELARRIEAAEVRGLVAAAEAVGERREVTVLPFGGGAAVLAGADSPLTKVAGLGWGGLSSSALERAEAAFAEAGAPVPVELCHLADPTIAERLTRRGYVLRGYESVLGLALDGGAKPSSPPAVRIERAEPGDLQPWLRVMVDGFMARDGVGLPSHESFGRAQLSETLSLHAAAPGYERYVARVGDTPAGAANLRLDDGIAQLCGAATLPEHRRRGVQSALLAHRLARAVAAGCELAVLTCLPASKSQQNAQRQGFELLYTRAILVHDPAPAR